MNTTENTKRVEVNVYAPSDGGCFVYGSQLCEDLFQLILRYVNLNIILQDTKPQSLRF
jgi:hypothetical protein